MIACLQMYDWPEVHATLDRFWHCVSENLRESGIAAPSALERPDVFASGWRDPDLLLGQTCGLPFVSGRCGEAVLVGQPDFGIQGASDGRYTSALVCRADDPSESLASFRGRVAAINEYGSQSGCNALADAVLDIGAHPDATFFSGVRVSGAHRVSANLVAAGGADIAAIDAVAWALHGAFDSDAHARLRVLEWTRSMPALPYICAPRFADLRPDLLVALNGAVSSRDDWPMPVPRMGVAGTEQSEYDPVRRMAQRVRGLKLAPDAPPIGD